MAWLTVFYTASVVMCTSFGYFVYTAYQHRRRIYKLHQQGVPMPKEWSWVFGHLMVLQKYVDKLPTDAAVTYATQALSSEFADTELYFMDFWPVYPPLYVVFGPEASSQVCNKYNMPKTAVAFSFMKPVTGGPNLISMNGDEWKRWRSLFNPGFSTAAMINNVPHVVDSALTFREKLIEHIGNGQAFLDDLATKLTMEIILKVTLYIRKELEKRFQEIKEQNVSGEARRSKSVISLALEAYITEQNNSKILGSDLLDNTFADYATWQIRLFLFAGADTTATMLVYIYHSLAKHPAWHHKLRQEHDEIFGKDPSSAARILKENPKLLNSCRLTIAFIKEVLRLFTPAGTMRAGLPGHTITDLQGKEQPMDYAGANVLHQALHLNPRVWPRPRDFLPERFLAESGHELYPDPAAFRPFEQGPRNCIGQTLVWNELRVVTILTCRDFQIRDGYAEYDRQLESELSLLSKLRMRMFGKPLKTVSGERAYQTDTGGMHPADGYPCYISWADER